MADSGVKSDSALTIEIDGEREVREVSLRREIFFVFFLGFAFCF